MKCLLSGLISTKVLNSFLSAVLELAASTVVTSESFDTEQQASRVYTEVGSAEVSNRGPTCMSRAGY